MYGFFLFYVTYDDVLYNRAVIDNSEYSFFRSIPIAAKWISRCVRIKTTSRRWWYYPTKNLILILKWKSILTTLRLTKRQLRSERKKENRRKRRYIKRFRTGLRKIRLQSSYGIYGGSKAWNRLADVRCTKRWGRTEASVSTSNGANECSHKSGTETFWNHIKTT